jgi:peroxiredoxin
MAALCAWCAGRQAPPFTMLRVKQPSLKLSQYRGKVVVLAFISTTCDHCAQLTTELNQIAHDFATRGVQVIECAFNDDAPRTMPEFLERFAPPFPVTYSTAAAAAAFLQHSILDPSPIRVPHVVIIDRAGVIRAELEGATGPMVRAQLEQLLKP